MLIVIQLQSHSKFYALFHRKMREAHNSFRTSFLLHSLNPVFLEIYRAHSTDSSIVYRFSPEAQYFFNDIMRAYQISNWNQLEVHRSTWQGLFVFTPILILEQILGRMEGQISIPVEISLYTITSAKQLLDHIMRQNEVILDVSF